MKCHIDVTPTLRSIALKEVFLPARCPCHCQAFLLLTLKSLGTASPMFSSYLPSEEMLFHPPNIKRTTSPPHKKRSQVQFFFCIFLPSGTFCPIGHRQAYNTNCLILVCRPHFTITNCS